MSKITNEAILDALRVVEDPDVHRSIVEMEMVRKVEIHGSRVKVEVVLTIQGCPLHHIIEQQVKEAVLAVPGVTDVDLTVGTMTDEEREKFAAKLRGKEVSQSPLLSPDVHTEFIAVASGKGGVGKSTVTANLAVALAKRGLRVGVIDADIYGFSLPGIFGVSEVKPAVVQDLVMPVQTHGVKLVSMQFFVPGNRPVIWRGPMLGKMLKNFFQEVHWGDLDVMLLDLPPGTGDMALDVHSTLPKSKELIVTTPQNNAADVAVRAGVMAQQVKHEVVGVIENMAYFICDHCNEKHYIFGKDGGATVAGVLKTELLAQIPVAEVTDRQTGIFDEGSVQAKAFEVLAEQLSQKLALNPATVRSM